MDPSHTCGVHLPQALQLCANPTTAGGRAAADRFRAVQPAVGREFRHSADTPSPSLLKRLLKGEGDAAEWRSRRRANSATLILVLSSGDLHGGDTREITPFTAVAPPNRRKNRATTNETARNAFLKRATAGAGCAQQAVRSFAHKSTNGGSSL